MTIQFWTKTIKKLVQNYQKSAETKKRSKKSKRWDIKNLWTIHFLTKTTQKCANLVHIILVIRFFNIFPTFQICTFQWLNCTNLKYELNRSYNSGGVIYVMNSKLSISSIQYMNVRVVFWWWQSSSFSFIYKNQFF